MFTDAEIEYLSSQRLGRLATVTAKNEAHVVPTEFRVSDDHAKIEFGGHNLAVRRPLYLRNIESNQWVAFVVDDLASTDPWTPRGVTVRGRADIHSEGGDRMGQGFDSTLIVITPASIISWGIDGPAVGPPSKREIS